MLTASRRVLGCGPFGITCRLNVQLWRIKLRAILVELLGGNSRSSVLNPLHSSPFYERIYSYWICLQCFRGGVGALGRELFGSRWSSIDEVALNCSFNLRYLLKTSLIFCTSAPKNNRNQSFLLISSLLRSFSRRLNNFGKSFATGSSSFRTIVCRYRKKTYAMRLKKLVTRVFSMVGSCFLMSSTSSLDIILSSTFTGISSQYSRII